jgi:hypothetical protein
VVAGHCLTQSREASHRQTGFARGVLAQYFDDGRGHGEGRLPEAELEDRPACVSELVATIVDGDGG